MSLPKTVPISQAENAHNQTPKILLRASSEREAAFEALGSQTKGKKSIAKIKGSETKPVIKIVLGERHSAVDAAESALIASNQGIYQRGGQLVRIITQSTKPIKDTITDKEDKSGQKIIKRSNDALLIAEVELHYLTELLDKAAIFKRYDERTKNWKAKDCPEIIAKALIARRDWNVPVLTGIIQAPTLRPDGSILETAGYDKDTGLMFNPGKISFEKIPETPTREDAIEALNILLDLLGDFPFENDESKSVALSAILTCLVRKSIRTAPLHGFTAPKMASGKSLLGNIAGLIATGKNNCAIPQADNEAEEKKRLLAVLAEGDPIICIDNIERSFGSSALCSILTETEYKDRVLGSTKSMTVLTNATFIANGNNLTFIGDLSTRAILCRLDPNVERPEERGNFKISDLRKHVQQHRGQLVKAALTILRAYHVAGRPKQNLKQFGRFEEWSDLVRSALVWLGQVDPCKSRKEIENNDPVRISLGALLKAWYAIFDNMSVKVKNVVNRAMEQNEHDEVTSALKEVLFEIAPADKGGINERVLGKKLASFKGRIENGYRLDSQGSSSGVSLWKVTRVEQC